MLYIVPSRGRPHVMDDFINAWSTTRTLAHLLIVVDDDDPELNAYAKILHDQPDWVRWVRFCCHKGASGGGGFVRALNEFAASPHTTKSHDVIGFMGDDHRPRTLGWDAMLEGPGRERIVYGDDLLQRQNLPTAVAMPRRFIEALGFMAPPVLTHLYVDNYWAALGGQVGLEYVPQAVIEHMHPVAGKADWDERYKAVNAGELYQRDSIAYHKYVGEGRLEEDVQKILAVK